MLQLGRLGLTCSVPRACQHPCVAALGDVGAASGWLPELPGRTPLVHNPSNLPRTTGSLTSDYYHKWTYGL